ncbi:unnamed protein product [Brassica napus]|uniref:(rape) hypothetical protein n=1 Tax=Brassica napus TaxID=3708 RepID=A0A817BLE8_BRANA|nr:unnamed protein product [Brassica napus]
MTAAASKGACRFTIVTMMTPSQSNSWWFVHVPQQQEDEEMLVPHSDLVDGTAQPMEVSETEAAVSTVENQQPAEDPPTLKFTWTVPNFSRQNTRKHYSQVHISKMEGRYPAVTSFLEYGQSRQNIAASRKPRQVDLLNLSPMEGSAIKGVSMLTLNESDTKKTRPRKRIGAAVVELYGEDAEQKVMDLDGSIMEMSLLTLNERDTTKRTTRPRKRDIGRVRVMGYNIDLPQDDVESALRNHFSSCGKITDVCVIVLDDNMLDSFGFIYFLGGQGTVDRAMQLSGTDVGGWNVTVKPYPFLEDADWDPVAIVQGYDTCLGKTDIKRMLFDHFSSCGQIKDIMFQRSSIGVASVYLYGEGAEDKVLDLDGSYMGGCKILVKLIPSSGIYTVHPRSRHLGWPSPILAMSSRPPGMSLLTLNENDAKKNRPKNSYIGRILVKGYNTQLSHDDVESSLRKLFSSCGEITDVYISVLADNTLDSFGFVYFLGEGAVDKALQLSGSDMGGWTVIAEPHPFPEDADCDPVVAVQGYDTSLSKSDIKKVLTTHFSSCGEVTEIRIHKKIGAAAVCVYGECAEEKVQDLDGSYIGEHKITVRLISAREIYSVHPRRRYRCPFPGHRTFGFSGLLARRECVSSRDKYVFAFQRMWLQCMVLA